MKKGDKAKVSPKLTGENEWIEGEIIDIEKNPFKGIVISIKDKLGRIFFSALSSHRFGFIDNFVAATESSFALEPIS